MLCIHIAVSTRLLLERNCISFYRSNLNSVWRRAYCWRSRDELISDVLQWTPSYGRTKAGWPARTHIQQLCEDLGCSPEDLPKAMNEKGSGISVMMERQDDDDDDDILKVSVEFTECMFLRMYFTDFDFLPFFSVERACDKWKAICLIMREKQWYFLYFIRSYN